MSAFFVGVDLGQRHDPSTIAVIERAELNGGWDAAAWAWRKHAALRLRLLERMPLGTPYTEVVERVREVAAAPALGGQAHLAVDATGVGLPVMELLRRARPPARLMPVMVTSGALEGSSDGFYLVPKRDLIVGLEVLFERGELQIAHGIPEGDKLVEELAGMRVKVTLAGNEQYGAWREGAHDDLVFAVSLACWAAGKAYPGRLSGEDGYWTNRNEAEAAEVFQKVMRERRGW